MKSRFKVLGHPAHPTQVVFPLAFYPQAAVAEVVYQIQRAVGYSNTDYLLNFDVGFWWRAGFWMLLIGLLGHAAAALPGFIDWLNIPNAAPAKDKATFHLIVAIFLAGIAVMALLLLNLGEPPAQLRFPEELALLVGVGLNLFNGFILATYQGWLGGELVYRHGIGVERTDDIDPITVTPGAEVLQDNA
jgi:uncharacterized membrane protein